MKTRKSSKRKRGAAVGSTTWLGFVPSFMVWVNGAYGPAKRHNEIRTAMEEAERLCRKENKPVYVLADVWKCETIAPPVKWTPSNIKAKKTNHTTCDSVSITTDKLDPNPGCDWCDW